MATLRAGAASPGLDEVLSGRLGVGPVRRVVLDPLRHGLRPALAQVLPEARPGRLQVVRSKFKPGRKLTAHYVAGTPRAPVHLAATWSATPATDGPRVRVLVAPDDPDMPQLARLTEPAHLSGVLDHLLGSHGAAWRPDVRTIRYRPGERHVLAVTAAAGGPAVVVKTDRDRSGERAVPVAGAVTTVLASRCPQAAAARALGWLPDDSAAVWGLEPGTPLSRSLADRGRGCAAEVALLGRALRVVHDDAAVTEHLAAAGVALPVRCPDDELSTTRRAAEHLGVLLPSVAGAVDAVLESASAALRELEPAAPRLVHGDLKADNVLTGSGLRMLDLDRAGLGDPAADLARLTADLHWWCPGRLGGAHDLVAALREGYGDGAQDRWSRAAALVPVFRVRSAARRCPVHERDWSGRIEALLSAAGAGEALW